MYNMISFVDSVGTRRYIGEVGRIGNGGERGLERTREWKN